jgi:hypothetical protein
MEVPHALRQVAQGEAHVQHLVVEGEIAHGRQTQIGLVCPVTPAQLRAQRFQFAERGLAFPIGLKGKFQFALRADAREAQVVCRCHGVALIRSGCGCVDRSEGII